MGAGKKLALLCALSLLAFFAGMPGLIAASAVVAAASAVARLGIVSLFSGSRPLIASTLIVVALRAVALETGDPFTLRIDEAGLLEGLLFAWGVLASFALGSALFATTTTAELRDSLSRMESRMKRHAARILPPAVAKKMFRFDLSLTVALALAFIPRVFSVWEEAEQAHRARCGRRGVAGTATLIPLVAERLIEAAAETAHAMVSRGYEGGAPFSLD